MTDPLLAWRPEFPILETCTYLVSHSLGAMPRRTRDYLTAFADAWSERGVQAWHEGWWEIGRTTGNLLARILGAAPDAITMHQNATVAQGIITSCFSFEGPRRRIVLQDLDFPTNHYLFEGCRRYGADVVYVKSDDRVRAPIDRLLDAIDDRTLLVPISLVLFRSGCLQDVRPVIDKAHAVGARVILDVYQGAGTVPTDLAALAVDFAVGGSVKWLCGGPGAGYLYVRPDLVKLLRPSFVGWAGHATPFAFETGAIRYADSIERFQSGTPNVPALAAARAGYEIVAEIGVPAIRERSLRLTRRMLDAARSHGWRLNTPTDDAERGGSVVIDVPDAARVTEELIARGVIVDYRPDAGIRMAPHFYNTEAEVDHAMSAVKDILSEVRTSQFAVRSSKSDVDPT
jgi:kynureninase